MYAPWYDAIQKFFGRARYLSPNGKVIPSYDKDKDRGRVPVVFAAPNRAHEVLKEIVQQRLKALNDVATLSGGARSVRPQTQLAIEDRPMPAPFMSVWMTRPQFDASYFNPGRVVVSKDKQSGNATTMRWPRPMRAQIQVELWTGEDDGEFAAQRITAQIDLQFPSQRVALPVNWADSKWYKPPFNVLEHAKVLGNTRIRLELGQGWQDNSDLEFGTGYKEWRSTWTGEVFGYIPYPPNEARLVRTVCYDVFDNTDEDNPTLIDSLVTGVED